MRKRTVVYQVFPRLFGNANTQLQPNGTLEQNGCGKLSDFDAATLGRIRQLGATHVWYTGVIRHATTTDYSRFGVPRQTPMVVKGKAGSPYAIADYYDIDPDLASDPARRMEEFVSLVERTHAAGLKVVIDFVPNHVAREYHSVCRPDNVKDLGENDDSHLHFSTHNNFYYCWGHALDTSDIPHAEGPEYEECPAKATGNDQFGWRPGSGDWYETVKLNYGIDYCDAGGRSEHFCPIPDTWSKMTDILFFWAAKGVDAFRCDMAEMVPAAFWHWATDKVKFAYPHIVFIGEVYNPSLYRQYLDAGFDYLYDKVGMYDCMRDVICHRRVAGDITAQWQASNDFLPHMLFFLENHDEQRIASDFFAALPQRGIPGMMAGAWLHTGPVMVYAGQEFGETAMEAEGFSGLDGRTTIFDYWALGTLQRGFGNRKRMKKGERELLSTYTKILCLVNDDDALREGAFYDLMYVNPHLERQYAFMRKYKKEVVLVVTNFDDEPASCQVTIPRHAFDWWEMPAKETKAIDLMTGQAARLVLHPDAPFRIDVPPLGGIALRINL